MWVEDFAQASYDVSPTRIRVPSSFSRLAPPKFPETRHVLEARQLTRELVEKAGFAPGTYTSIDSDLYKQVVAVYDGLTRAVNDLIDGTDAVQLCASLYERHENIVEHMVSRKHSSAIDQMAKGVQTPSTDVDRDWSLIAPLTESIRWLIEYCVKNCSTNGRKLAAAKEERLIALAVECFMWDFEWENISRDVFAYEFEVSSGFELRFRLTEQSQRARAKFDSERIPYIQKSDNSLADSVRLTEDRIRPQEIKANIERAAEYFDVEVLEEAMEQERGYKFSDWAKYAHGLIDSFEEHEYFKTIGSKKLSKFMSQEWGLDRHRFDMILNDHALSNAVVADLGKHDLEPVGQARRDTRLLRRPVLRFGHHKGDLLMYGIEAVTVGFQIYFDLLLSGRVQLPDMQRRGPLTKAFGRLQTTRGDEFRDRIAELAQSENHQTIKEKEQVGSVRIPQGAGFGPVDVFVIDRDHKRFVLAETKDVADEGTVPRYMLKERDEFLTYLEKLHKQTAWFAERIDALKDEYSLAKNENWSVEGVVVVKAPRAWMYTCTEPWKIVHELRFFNLLKNGGQFVTNPIR